MASIEVLAGDARAASDAESELEERVLWQRFRAADSPEEFFQSWLSFQCRMLDGVTCGLLLLRRNESDGSFETATTWPEGSRARPHLLKAAERALTDKRALALKLDPQGDQSGSRESRTVVAQVVEVDGDVVGTVVLEVQPRRGDALERMLRRLGWGTAWIELALQRSSNVAGRADQLDALLDIVACSLEHDRFRTASSAFVTELSTRLGCERVSLGFVHRGRIRLMAVSHSAQFSERANLSRAVEAAMEEALEQESTVVWPAREGSLPQVTRSHEALCEEGGADVMISIPISHGSRFCGVLLLERKGASAFSASEQELIETVVDLAGPMLDIQHRDDRWIAAKVVDSMRDAAERLVGPGYIGFKLGAALVSTVLLFLVLVRGDYRVVADTVIEAQVMRAAVAPFDGYIAEAPARAGDRLQEGDLLVRLDDRDLRLQEARFRSEIAQLDKEVRQAMAERNAANVHILSARIEQVSSELELTQSHLRKTRILAPFDGIVVTGDLSQQLQSPVERGELLFEIAPEGEFRVVVDVDESEIDEMILGQKGELVFSAFPDRAVGITISNITPVSEAKDGKNTFRVEASLDETPPRIQPGMEGIAKIFVDRRKLIWIWSHDVLDWLRLVLWRWTP